MTTMTFTYVLNLPSYDNHDLHICLKFTFIWQPWPSHMSIKFTFLWQPWTSHTLYVSYIYLLMSIMTTMTFTYVCYLNLPSYEYNDNHDLHICLLLKFTFIWHSQPLKTKNNDIQHQTFYCTSGMTRHI
jgi:hypothetical protein